MVLDRQNGGGASRLVAVVSFFLMLFAPPLFPCDPNFAQEEMVSGPLRGFLRPLVLQLATVLAVNPEFKEMPAQWEEFQVAPSSGATSLAPLEKAAFIGILAGIRTMQGQSPSSQHLGRVLFEPGELEWGLARNALATGTLQNLVVQMSSQGRARVCLYEPKGEISFIDEIRLNVNFQVITIWPPILPPHLKFWTADWMWDWSLRGEHQE